MNLLLIRHALPMKSAPGDGADPPLAELGEAMATRLPTALRRYGVTRILSSPQRRAHQTAEALAAECGLGIEIDQRLAEYDFGLSEYVPVEMMRAEDPGKLARLVAGELPEGVDADAFARRVHAAADDIIATSQSADTVAVFSHGGAINVLLQRALGTPRIFPFPLDYVSVTHLRQRSDGSAIVHGVNNIEHVWDLLPRLSKRRS
jgi:probable phosphoglycerate mutase